MARALTTRRASWLRRPTWCSVLTGRGALGGVATAVYQKRMAAGAYVASGPSHELAVGKSIDAAPATLAGGWRPAPPFTAPLPPPPQLLGSYLLDPVIRRATQVDPGGAVLIFDEAHTIEDIAR